MDEETKEAPKHDYGTLDEALDRWNKDELVTTIEMGGLGPDYEQGIQISVFELLNDLKDVEIPFDDNEATSKLIEETFYKTIARVKELDGLSGAMAGAAMHVAYMFRRHGYSEAINMADQDRRIQCKRKFP